MNLKNGWLMVLMISAVMVLAVGCAGYSESGLPGSAASMARNQIMWIDEEAGTLGHRRLQALSKSYPDLALFVSKRGRPDFMAETADRTRAYFILYYLEDRQAYACRTRSGGGGAIEFAGPYPVTDKEYETLDGFRGKVSR